MIRARLRQLGDMGRDVRALGLGAFLQHDLEAQFLGGLAAVFDRIAPELGVGEDEGHLLPALVLDVLQEDVELALVGRPREILVRVRFWVGEFRGEGGRAHDAGVLALQFRRNQLHRAGAVGEIADHVLAFRGQRTLVVVERVLRHVARILGDEADRHAGDAALVVEELGRHGKGGRDKLARGGERTRERQRGAEHVFLGLGAQDHRRADGGRRGGGGGEEGSAVHGHLSSP